MTIVNNLALFDNHDCFRGDVLFNLKRSQVESGIYQDILQSINMVDEVLIGFSDRIRLEYCLLLTVFAPCLKYVIRLFEIRFNKFEYEA